MRHLLIGLMGLAGAVCAAPLPAQENTWEELPAMPTARESVGACAVNGQIYVIGGFPGGGDAGLGTNERFDPQTGSWSTMAPMPTARRLPGTAVAAIGGKCYVTGGRLTDDPRGLDAVEEYDPATNSWRARAPMPERRFAQSVAVVDDILYVFGGGHMQVLASSVLAYDPATDQWETRGPMPAARGLAGATALNGKIYLVGGTQDGDFSNFSRVDIYDPATDSWTRGADLPSARFSLQAETVNGRVYALGGADGPGAIDDAVVYDPGTNAWSALPSMRTPRARAASAVVGGQIYAIGGTTSFAVPHVGMDRVERFTPGAIASSFVVNAGITDAWYNPATNGQGLLITVFPDLQQMFLAWFTYDTERPDPGVQATLGEPGHRWLTAQGPYSGDTAELTVYVTEGGRFDSPTPEPQTDAGGVGTMTVEFADCENGLVTYQLDAPNQQGEIPIQRIVTDRVALCEALQNP